MSISRFDPFRDLVQLQHEMNRALDGRLFRTGQRSEENLSYGFHPAVDVYEDAEGVTLTAEVPGVDPRAVNVRVENNLLTLSGERKLEREEKKDNYLRVERSYGTFSRTFSLPPTVNPDAVKAELKNGLLRVFLPRKEETKPRQIQVKVTE